MKLRLISILTLFLFTFISCSDDESESTENNPLIGTWKWTVNQRLDCGQDTGSFDVYDCSEFCYEVKFAANGIATVTVQEDGGTITGEGTYELVDNELTICVIDPTDNNEYCYSGELTISGDKFELFIPKPSSDVCDVIRHFEKK